MAPMCPHCQALNRLGSQFCSACGRLLQVPPPPGPSAWIIGSGSQCDLRVCAPTVSEHHCRLVFEQGDYYVEDLGSTNGTFLEEQPINQRTLVHPRMRITLGRQVPMPWPAPPKPQQAPIPAVSMTPSAGVPGHRQPVAQQTVPSRGTSQHLLSGLLLAVGFVLVVVGAGWVVTGYQQENSWEATLERSSSAVASLFNSRSPLGNKNNAEAEQQMVGGAICLGAGFLALLIGFSARPRR